jgi:hypothetical protein
MRIINPNTEKECVCADCHADILYTEQDVLYSYYYDKGWSNKIQIECYITCPKCHKDQFVDIIDYDSNLTENQFKQKYKGRILGEIPDKFNTDLKYRFDLDYGES